MRVVEAGIEAYNEYRKIINAGEEPLPEAFAGVMRWGTKELRVIE